MSPGPDLAIVTRQTLAHGRGAGLRTALGIACRDLRAYRLCHVWTGLGDSSLPAAADRAALCRRLAAAVDRLGMRCAPDPPPERRPAAAGTRAAARDFGIGFLTNALNVKAHAVLRGAVLGGDHHRGFGAAAAGMGAWMIFATGLWFCFVAWTLGHPRVRARLQAYGHWIDRVMGAILLLLGCAMLLQGLLAE